MANLLLVTMWVASAGVRVVPVNAQTPQKIVVNVSPNITTTVRFTQPVDVKSLTIGDPDRFDSEANSPLQVNLKALSRKYGYSSNMNLMSVGNEALVFELRTVVPEEADNVVTVELPAHAAPPVPCNEQTEAAVKAVSQTEEQQLLRELADSLRVAHLDSRTVKADIILQILDTVHAGARAWVRFAVQNRSRTRWQAGELKLEMVSEGRVAALPVHFFLPQTPLAPEETVFGALAVPLGNAKTIVHMRVEEKNGARAVTSSDFSF